MTFPRAIPLKANGYQILDAAGQMLGSTSSEAMTAALVSAFNSVHANVEVPNCDVCGSITVAVVGAYRCLNCGNTMAGGRGAGEVEG
jgi:ribosomal protein L37AE/L43A